MTSTHFYLSVKMYKGKINSRKEHIGLFLRGQSTNHCELYIFNYSDMRLSCQRILSHFSFKFFSPGCKQCCSLT